MVEKDGNWALRSAERARFAQCTDPVDIVVVRLSRPCYREIAGLWLARRIL
jgi:hypothetical protein